MHSRISLTLPEHHIFCAWLETTDWCNWILQQHLLQILRAKSGSVTVKQPKHKHDKLEEFKHNGISDLNSITSGFIIENVINPPIMFKGMIPVASQRIWQIFKLKPSSYCQPLSRLIHFQKGKGHGRWTTFIYWNCGQLLGSLWYIPKEKGKDYW